MSVSTPLEWHRGSSDSAVDIGGVRTCDFGNQLTCSRIVDGKAPAAAVSPFPIHVILPVILRLCLRSCSCSNVL